MRKWGGAASAGRDRGEIAKEKSPNPFWCAGRRRGPEREKGTKIRLIRRPPRPWSETRRVSKEGWRASLNTLHRMVAGGERRLLGNRSRGLLKPDDTVRSAAQEGGNGRETARLPREEQLKFGVNYASAAQKKVDRVKYKVHPAKGHLIGSPEKRKAWERRRPRRSP